MCFKRKRKNVDWEDIAKRLSELEPSKMDRLVEIAKDMRKNNYSISVFVNGRPDEIDKAEKEMKKEVVK